MPWMDYQAYIESPEWRERAKDATARAAYKCQVCSSMRRLNVHHNTYDRLGSELATDLCVLCTRCHELFHKIINGKPTRMPDDQRKQPLSQRPRTVEKRLQRQLRKARKHQARMERDARKKAARLAGVKYEIPIRPTKRMNESQIFVAQQLANKGAVNPRLLKTGFNTAPSPVATATKTAVNERGIGSGFNSHNRKDGCSVSPSQGSPIEQAQLVTSQATLKSDLHPALIQSCSASLRDGIACNEQSGPVG